MKQKVKVNSNIYRADIYILEDPQERNLYNEIRDTCTKISTGITIGEWHDYNNNPTLKNINNMKHCDAAIDINRSNKRLFILLEITSLIHYCEEEDKLKSSNDFFYTNKIIDNSTKILPVVDYKRKPGKSEGEKGIKIGRNKGILMQCHDTLIQLLSDYNLI